MRIAQLNQCVVCMGFRAESVQRQGLTEDFYEHVAEYHVDDRYSAQERLAIEYAERFALDHTNIDQAFIDRLREQFDDGEILDLTVCLAAFLGLGRVLNVLGIEETCLVDVYAPSESGAAVNR
jgi:alkylhydroperoxidase family enzyme